MLLRLLRSFTLLLLLLGGVWALNRSWSAVPALGPLLVPQTGWIANGDENNLHLEVEKLSHLKGEAQVWVDKRWVPHIRASNAEDVYYLQGYIHAWHRLWQMDMQTRAAAGRISEVAGPKAIEFDRGQRRKGMVYGAENSLRMMESDPHTKLILDAYTQGVNDFIAGLEDNQYPVEYKLMSFKPEPWSNMRTALMLKMMADDLSGKTNDFAMSWLRTNLPDSLMRLFYPERLQDEYPVIPTNNSWKSIAAVVIPAPPDSLQIRFEKDSLVKFIYDEPAAVGSNNWAVTGSRTASGSPILCNDPHLGLTLPSLWFEIQLQCDEMNVYGVSLPGAPGVIIGFNDSIAWGLTNNARDVKDYYFISEADQDHYWFDGTKKKYQRRVEQIVVKGGARILDTVRYTLHGPIEFDEHFIDPAGTGKKYAVHWMAHEPSNELKTISMINEAENVHEFRKALPYFFCPAQNFVYADRAGNIGLFTQGRFVQKWYNQGTEVMDGSTSATLWGDYIPMDHNPYELNPEREFVSSANQVNTDSTYPYWYNGGFVQLRGWELKRNLSAMHNSSIRDHQQLQNSYHSILAEEMIPLFLKRLPDSNAALQADFKKEINNFQLTPDSKAAAFFMIWWHEVQLGIWQDELLHIPDAFYPSVEVSLNLIKNNSQHPFIDDQRTTEKETLDNIIEAAYYRAKDSLAQLGTAITWAEAKKLSIYHLAKIPAFSKINLPVGGWNHTINAMKQMHGPSWRMIVEMGKDSIRAFGIYPGGQSGHPSSSHYSNMITDWVRGDYHPLLFLPNSATQTHADFLSIFNLSPKRL